MGSDWQKKDLEEKQTALVVIEKQYPGMERIRELMSSDPDQARREYASVLIACVSEQLGIPQSGVDILGGKPYVNKTGLTAKVQKDPRQVKSIRSVPILYPMKIAVLNVPSGSELADNFIGYTEDGTAVHKGIVEFHDGSRFEDEGSANAKYLNKDWGKMSTMIPYVNELAITRAINRAMRLATGVGLVSIEELNDRGYSIIKDNMKMEVSGKKSELIDEVNDLFVKLKVNEAKIIMYCNKIGGVSDPEFMSEEGLGAMKNMLTIMIKEKSTKKIAKKPLKSNGKKNETKNSVKSKAKKK